MIAIPASVRRHIGPSAFALFTILATFAFTGPQSALAGLIFTQVGLDGHVRNNNGSGPVAGVETHFTTDDFEPPTMRALPATPPAPPAPLLAAVDLRINSDYVAFAPLNGETFQRAMLWITSPTTGNIFRNSLDDLLAAPVELDTFVYLEELLPNQQLDIEAVRVEVFGIPNSELPANSFISNNIGSAADPIHIHLGFAQDQLLLNALKMFIYYDTTGRVIPEPATAGLLWAVIVGAVAMRRRLS
jgi:hypothetical protein